MPDDPIPPQDSDDAAPPEDGPGSSGTPTPIPPDVDGNVDEWEGDRTGRWTTYSRAAAAKPPRPERYVLTMALLGTIVAMTAALLVLVATNRITADDAAKLAAISLNPLFPLLGLAIGKYFRD